VTKTLETAIEIEAPPARVWRVLSDFAAYPAWNPFIRRIEGDARPGARLTVVIQPVGGRGMTFRPTVLVAEPERELRWLGRLVVAGLFDGEHGFRLEARGAGGTRFVQREVFRGLLVPLLARTWIAARARGSRR
jgi:hypothetical protein